MFTIYAGHGQNRDSISNFSCRACIIFALNYSSRNRVPTLAGISVYRPRGVVTVACNIDISGGEQSQRPRRSLHKGTSVKSYPERSMMYKYAVYTHRNTLIHTHTYVHKYLYNGTSSIHAFSNSQRAT